MKCHDVRQNLAAYLDNEVTPQEQEQVQEHIGECANCQAEIASLESLQSHLKCSFKAEAARVAPAPDAWERLQANLADDPIHAPSNGKGLLRRLGLLGSDRQETYRKNKPASSSDSLGRLSFSDLNIGWHQKLVLATRWSMGLRNSKRIKKGMHFRNKPTDEAGNDILK
jgi:hypothetical protein